MLYKKLLLFILINHANYLPGQKITVLPRFLIKTSTYHYLIKRSNRFFLKIKIGLLPPVA